VTWLAGAAALFSQARDAWHGTLMAVFQPGEETAEGAQAMIDDGLFKRFPKPDVVLGQHVMVGPAGAVAGRTGAITSAADSLQIRLFGRGAHGSMPQASIDPVVMAAATVMRLQTIVSRELAAAEAAVVTIGSLQAGTKENVIPDEATIKLNVRTFDEDVRRKVRGAIERIANAESDASGAPKPRSPEDAGVLPEAAGVHTDFRSSPCRMGPRSPRPLGRARIPQTGRILPNFREWV
jgi:amidohydrolase